MTPEQHIAALQHIIADTARYGGVEARAAIGLSIVGAIPDDTTIRGFLGPDWPTGVVDPEGERLTAVATVMDRSGWKGVNG